MSLTPRSWHTFSSSYVKQLKLRTLPVALPEPKIPGISSPLKRKCIQCRPFNLLARIEKPPVPATAYNISLPQSRPEGSFDGNQSFSNYGALGEVPQESVPARPRHLDLPISCPGCGALTQDVDPGEAGFYTRSRRAVKSYLRSSRQNAAIGPQDVDEIRTDDDQELDVVILNSDATTDGGPGAAEHHPSIPVALQIPICDRCHNLVHNSRGTPIAHPSIEAIADSIVESPFRRNHVYHVLDAADFPMSLIPSIHQHLSLAKPRTQNRRARHESIWKPTLSFIITRSDLLAPNKEMVDSLMPYYLRPTRSPGSRRPQHATGQCPPRICQTRLVDQGHQRGHLGPRWRQLDGWQSQRWQIQSLRSPIPKRLWRPCPFLCRTRTRNPSGLPPNSGNSARVVTPTATSTPLPLSDPPDHLSAPRYNSFTNPPSLWHQQEQQQRRANRPPRPLTRHRSFLLDSSRPPIRPYPPIPPYRGSANPQTDTIPPPRRWLDPNDATPRLR